MFRVVILLALVSLAVCQREAKPDFGLLSDEEIFYINHISQASWKATNNFQQKNRNAIKNLFGVKDMRVSLKRIQEVPMKDHGKFSVKDLPATFDARVKWSGCASLREIADQGNCRSSWAIGAVSAMTDRICIKSGGKKIVHLSAENLMTCCNSCGDCDGGYPLDSWQYYQSTGIVTGGRYGSNQGCQPYKFPNCDRGVNGKNIPCANITFPVPACSIQCQEGYKTTYQKDLHYGNSTYRVIGIKNIMKEIVENGPVETAFTVYADFLQYKSGVYSHTSGKKIGSHAVKLLGYGEEKGVKYWLAANSWNEDWGLKGFFKIVRGSNECGIETHVVAGEPKL